MSRLPFVSRIQFIRLKFSNCSAHASGVQLVSLLVTGPSPPTDHLADETGLKDRTYDYCIGRQGSEAVGQCPTGEGRKGKRRGLLNAPRCARSRKDGDEGRVATMGRLQRGRKGLGVPLSHAGHPGCRHVTGNLFAHQSLAGEGDNLKKIDGCGER